MGLAAAYVGPHEDDDAPQPPHRCCDAKMARRVRERCVNTNGFIPLVMARGEGFCEAGVSCVVQRVATCVNENELAGGWSVHTETYETPIRMFRLQGGWAVVVVPCVRFKLYSIPLWHSLTEAKSSLTHIRLYSIVTHTNGMCAYVCGRL